MGLLNDYSSNEINLLLDQFYESAKLHGTLAYIETIVSSQEDLNNDPDYQFYPPIPVYILLNEHPTPRFLETLGWYAEDRQELPIVATIPSRTEDGMPLDIKPGVRVTIPYHYNPLGAADSGRTFEITRVKGSHLNSLFYTCTLVPVRKVETNTQDKSNPKLDTTNFSFLNVDKE